MSVTPVHQPIVLTHTHGTVTVIEEPAGSRRIVAQPNDAADYSAALECSTTYPIELIDRILAVKGPLWLCDEIKRDERAEGVALELRYGVLGFVEEDAFVGARLLDFGCGSGASTMVLARLLPETSIVGIDLSDALLGIARERARHYGFASMQFLLSPDPLGLPADIGMFDYIMLNAVFEHLLPRERALLLPKLWSLLNPGGVMFIVQTPYRFAPVDIHTTGLPLINYLPNRLAHVAATKLSRRVDKGASWEQLLRAGIRGGTEREVRGLLPTANGQAPIQLRPREPNLHDAPDLWYTIAMQRHASASRRAAWLMFKAVNLVTRDGFGTWLYMALRRPADAQTPRK